MFFCMRLDIKSQNAEQNNVSDTNRIQIVKGNRFDNIHKVVLCLRDLLLLLDTMYLNFMYDVGIRNKPSDLRLSLT